jgi:hypothetical protein
MPPAYPAGSRANSHYDVVGMGGSGDSLDGILDFNRLMEGENRRTEDPDDIRHWCAVYQDLVKFKEKLLSETEAHIDAVPATDSELGGNDVPFLQAELGRLQRGLEFWEGRRTGTARG